MPILALINGCPGTGKTTLAQRWAATHPLSVALDIDTVRSMIGGWRADEVNAGTLARALSVSMIRTALSEGHDVLVPQLVANPEFISVLAETAISQSSSFLHVVLTAPVDTCVQRCVARDNAAQFVDSAPNLLGMVEQWASALRETVRDDVVEINADRDADEVFDHLSSVITLSKHGPAMERGQ